MKIFLFFLLVVSLIFLSFCNNKNRTKEELRNVINLDGRSLFTSKCTSCHALNKKIIGPSLGKFVGSQDAFISSYYKVSTQFHGRKINRIELVEIFKYINRDIGY